MPFQPPVILLDKDDTLHPNLPHFLQVMTDYYVRHNYKQHLQPLEIVSEDYYLNNAAVKNFCAFVFPDDPAQAFALEERLFEEINLVLDASLQPHAALNALLHKLKGQGCVFGLITHNTRANTVKNLADIELADLCDPHLVLCFEDLVDARKSTPGAYHKMAERLQQVVPRHGEVYMVDDHPLNLAPVPTLGWHPIQIGDAPRAPHHIWPTYPALEDFLLTFSRRLTAAA